MKLKFDLHVHSENSFDSAMAIEEIVKEGKSRGLDGVCICDHDFTPTQKTIDNTDYDSFIIIPATEIATNYGHIICMFIEKEFKIDLDSNRHADIYDLTTKVHDAGGICIYAHPYERMKKGAQSVSTKIDKLIKVLDGIEVYNSRAPYKYKRANVLSLEKADSSGIICRTAGSDAHLPWEIGSAYCMIDAKSKSLNDIKNAILRGRVEIFGHHCKHVDIAKSQLIKIKKINSPVSSKIKTCIAYLYYLLLDIKDVIFRRKY